MIDLQEIGLSQEKLQQMVVDKIVDRLMFSTASDEDGYAWQQDSDFARSLESSIKEKIDAKVQELAEEHVRPVVEERIESLVIAETNRYGEKKGEPLTFTEYMAKRAEDYLHEDVDHWGKKTSTYDRAKQPRLTNIVDQYLRCRVEDGVKDATKDLAGEMGKAITQAIQQKMKEVQKSIKVDVKPSR